MCNKILNFLIVLSNPKFGFYVLFKSIQTFSVNPDKPKMQDSRFVFQFYFLLISILEWDLYFRDIIMQQLVYI